MPVPLQILQRRQQLAREHNGLHHSHPAALAGSTAGAIPSLLPRTSVDRPATRRQLPWLKLACLGLFYVTLAWITYRFGFPLSPAPGKPKTAPLPARGIPGLVQLVPLVTPADIFFLSRYRHFLASTLVLDAVLASLGTTLYLTAVLMVAFILLSTSLSIADRAVSMLDDGEADELPLTVMVTPLGLTYFLSVVKLELVGGSGTRAEKLAHAIRLEHRQRRAALHAATSSVLEKRRSVTALAPFSTAGGKRKPSKSSASEPAKHVRKASIQSVQSQPDASTVTIPTASPKDNVLSVTLPESDVDDFSSAVLDDSTSMKSFQSLTASCEEDVLEDGKDAADEEHRVEPSFLSEGDASDVLSQDESLSTAYETVQTIDEELEEESVEGDTMGVDVMEDKHGTAAFASLPASMRMHGVRTMTPSPIYSNGQSPLQSRRKLSDSCLPPPGFDAPVFKPLSLKDDVAQQARDPAPLVPAVNPLTSGLSRFANFFSSTASDTPPPKELSDLSPSSATPSTAATTPSSTGMAWRSTSPGASPATSPAMAADEAENWRSPSPFSSSLAHRRIPSSSSTASSTSSSSTGGLNPHAAPHMPSFDGGNIPAAPTSSYPYSSHQCMQRNNSPAYGSPYAGGVPLSPAFSSLHTPSRMAHLHQHSQGSGGAYRQYSASNHHAYPAGYPYSSHAQIRQRRGSHEPSPHSPSLSASSSVSPSNSPTPSQQHP